MVGEGLSRLKSRKSWRLLVADAGNYDSQARRRTAAPLWCRLVRTSSDRPPPVDRGCDRARGRRAGPLQPISSTAQTAKFGLRTPPGAACLRAAPAPGRGLLWYRPSRTVNAPVFEPAVERVADDQSRYSTVTAS